MHVLFANDEGHKPATGEELVAAFNDEVAALGLTEGEPPWASMVVLEAI